MKTSFKIATQGAMISIFVYLFLAISKLVVANIFQAGSLKADGLNNLTDIFSSAFVLLGIYFARVHFHRFIRQLKNVFYGKFRCGTPAGKTSQERQAQACQEIQGRNEFHQRLNWFQ